MATQVETRQTRGAELLGLLAFALALMLLIALATFDPRDPAPFFKAGVEGPARNFIGPFGAFLAEMLIPQRFGLRPAAPADRPRAAGLEAVLVQAGRGPLHEGVRQR